MHRAQIKFAGPIRPYKPRMQAVSAEPGLFPPFLKFVIHGIVVTHRHPFSIPDPYQPC